MNRPESIARGFVPALWAVGNVVALVLLGVTVHEQVTAQDAAVSGLDAPLSQPDPPPGPGAT